MATAREQAEDAVYDAMFKRLPNSTSQRKAEVKELAGVASDVWEPVLRDLLAVAWSNVESVHHERCSNALRPVSECESCADDYAVLRRAEEALGART